MSPAVTPGQEQAVAAGPVTAEAMTRLISTLNDVMVTLQTVVEPGEDDLEAVPFLVACGFSQRQASVQLLLPHSTFGYQARPAGNSELATPVHELARRHPRDGYRRVLARLRRRGQRVNKTHVDRLWKQATLLWRKRGSCSPPLAGSTLRSVRTAAWAIERQRRSSGIGSYALVIRRPLTSPLAQIIGRQVNF
jgi:hypothetical protein